MPRKKKVSAELVLARPAELMPKAPTQDLQEAIEAMVRKRVDELMGGRTAPEIGPTFQTRAAAERIRQRQDVFEHRKWALYFEEWGCLVCGKKDVCHLSKGFCGTCYNRVMQRLDHIKRKFDQANPEAEIQRQIDHLTSRVRSAKELLGG